MFPMNFKNITHLMIKLFVKQKDNVPFFDIFL